MNKVLATQFLFYLAACSSSVAHTVEWIEQIGTSGIDIAADVSVNALGDVYIGGFTRGSLAGISLGGDDAFVIKYRDANQVWARQLGTIYNDRINGIATDQFGNHFFAGETFGDFSQPTSDIRFSSRDGFVGMYDATGTLQWLHQFGTQFEEACRGISTDTLGNVYVVGDTFGSLDGTMESGRNAYLRKYDSFGVHQWTRHFGDPFSDDAVMNVFADAMGSVYVAGSTEGDFTGNFFGLPDAFVVKFDPAGTQLWTQLIGSSEEDHAMAVAVDSAGNVYITGLTNGVLGPFDLPDFDAFLTKLDPEGAPLWTRQFGADEFDVALDIAIVDTNIYVVGGSGGSLQNSGAGTSDIFVRKFNSIGNELWNESIGTASYDIGSGIAADGTGAVYFAGNSAGNLGGTAFGDRDPILGKIRDVPEPTTCAFVMAALPLMLRRSRIPCD